MAELIFPSDLSSPVEIDWLNPDTDNLLTIQFDDGTTVTNLLTGATGETFDVANIIGVAAPTGERVSATWSTSKPVNIDNNPFSLCKTYQDVQDEYGLRTGTDITRSVTSPFTPSANFNNFIFEVELTVNDAGIGDDLATNTRIQGGDGQYGFGRRTSGGFYAFIKNSSVTGGSYTIGQRNKLTISRSGGALPTTFVDTRFLVDDVDVGGFSKPSLTTITDIILHDMSQTNKANDVTIHSVKLISIDTPDDSRYWTFNRTAGNTVTDEFNGAIATLNNFPADSGYVRGADGAIVGYQFNGVDQSAVSSITAVNNEWEVNGYLSVDENNGVNNTGLVALNVNGTVECLGLGVSSNQKFKLFSNGKTSGEATATIVIGQVYKYRFTLSASGLANLYIDDDLVHTATDASLASNSYTKLIWARDHETSPDYIKCTHINTEILTSTESHYYDFTTGDDTKIIDTVSGNHATIVNNSTVKWQRIKDLAVYTVGTGKDYTTLSSAFTAITDVSAINELQLFGELTDTNFILPISSMGTSSDLAEWRLTAGDNAFDGTLSTSFHFGAAVAAGIRPRSFVDLTMIGIRAKRFSMQGYGFTKGNIRVIDSEFLPDDSFNQFCAQFGNGVFDFKNSRFRGYRTTIHEVTYATFKDCIIQNCGGYGGRGYAVYSGTELYNTIVFNDSNAYSQSVTLLETGVIGSNNITEDATAVTLGIGTQDANLESYLDANGQITEAGRTSIGTGTGWNGSTIALWADAVVSAIVDGTITSAEASGLLTQGQKDALGTLTEGNTVTITILGAKVTIGVVDGTVTISITSDSTSTGSKTADSVVINSETASITSSGTKDADGTSTDTVVLSYPIAGIKLGDGTLIDSIVSSASNTGSKTGNGVTSDSITSSDTSTGQKDVSDIITEIMSAIDTVTSRKIGLSAITTAISESFTHSSYRFSDGTIDTTMSILETVNGIKVVAGLLTGRITINISSNIPTTGLKDTTGTLAAQATLGTIIQGMKSIEDQLSELSTQAIITTGRKEAGNLIISAHTLAEIIQGEKTSPGSVILINQNSNILVQGSKTGLSSITDISNILEELNTIALRSGDLSMAQTIDTIASGTNTENAHTRRLETILGSLTLRYTPIIGKISLDTIKGAI